MTFRSVTFRPAIPWHRSTWAWFLSLLAVCAALRLFVALSADPILSLDSQGYLQLAGQIARLDLSSDGGMRTPGYPLFILVFGGDPANVRLAQMGLGLAITAMLFWLGRRMTGSDPLAAAVGAGYGLSLSQIYFESTPLTETISTFGVTLSVIALLMAFTRLDDGRSVGGWMLMLGLVTAMTALVRPSFVFLPVLLAGMMLIKLATLRAYRGVWLLIPALLPTIIVIGGWSAFNYARFGTFGPSIIGGFSLADHSVAFIEYAPDRYAVIRDTYLDLRRQYDMEQMSVWLGVEPLKQKLGMTTAQLSRELNNMSMDLFRRQPLRYAESVWATWLQFWNAYGGLRGVVAWEGARDPSDRYIARLCVPSNEVCVHHVQRSVPGLGRRGGDSAHLLPTTSPRMDHDTDAGDGGCDSGDGAADRDAARRGVDCRRQQSLRHAGAAVRSLHCADCRVGALDGAANLQDACVMTQRICLITHSWYPVEPRRGAWPKRWLTPDTRRS